MPLILDDLTSSAAAKKTLGPQYFSAVLTGNGNNTVGLINNTLRPGPYTVGKNSGSLNPDLLRKKSKVTSGDVTTHQIPMGLLTMDSITVNRSHGLTLAFPDSQNRFHINEGRSGSTADVYLSLTPQGMTLFESGGAATREPNILYRMEVWVVPVGEQPDRVDLVARPRIPSTPMQPKDAFVMVEYTFGPLDDVTALIKEATEYHSPGHTGIFVDMTVLGEWMSDYDLHGRISALAEAWSDEAIGVELARHIEELFVCDLTREQLNALAMQLRYLEAYPVTLEAYREIHRALRESAPEDIVATMSKQNMNLLMNATLADLDSLKPQLATPTLPQSAAAVLPAHFSAQQRNAITTDEPLSQVTAGAGTGKSTVILARIEHLISRGVDPSDITVLSFTNAAADNIKEKNPQVGSMTIASMIHDIYSMNHPGHEISSPDTIINSLDIHYPNSQMAQAFSRHLENVLKNEPGATTALNVFVERFYDEVLSVLDTLGQTSLELEIIMAYQKIHSMAEPAHVQCKYLIIDEVQDNSIFEFIYTLKYTAKHCANMFIVGDASQTLYEFRAANPKALNALESSGVFAMYPLTTNYRSNQEILDFANVHLADIEANKTAGLRLQANALLAPTEASFKEKVTLSYDLVPKLSAFKDSYEQRLMANDIRRYIDDKINRGEQVAFLAGKREYVKRTEAALEQLYPGKSIANLVSDRPFTTTVFSQFIKNFWNLVLQVPNVEQAAFVIHKGVQDNLHALTRNAEKARYSVNKLLHSWWITNAESINGWTALVNAGALSRDEFFDRLRDNLLQTEIAENRKKFTLTSERNRERKEHNLKTDADFVVSTIHGAKGLEFPHVVVLHEHKSSMAEDDKRMYYVAFTRAMETEFVLSYGTDKNPRIEADYQLMIEALKKRDVETALQALGIDPDNASEEDVAAALALAEQRREQQRAQQASNVSPMTPSATVGPIPAAPVNPVPVPA